MTKNYKMLERQRIYFQELNTTKRRKIKKKQKQNHKNGVIAKPIKMLKVCKFF